MPSWEEDHDRELERADRRNDHAPAGAPWPRLGDEFVEALRIPEARRLELVEGSWDTPRRPLDHATADLNEELRRRHVRRAEARRRARARRRALELGGYAVALALAAYVVYRGAGGAAWPTR